QKKEQGPSYLGTVKSFDASKRILTISVMTEPKSKKIEEKQWPVAADAKVILQDNLTKDEPAPEGRLDDLTPGTGVTVTLDLDKKNIVAISARGRGLNGGVKSVDAAKGTITVMVKGKKGAEEITLQIAKGCKIFMNDGIGKKGDQPKEGKLDDLKE